MTTEEPQCGDEVMYGHRSLTIDGFSEDDETRLSDGRWICATLLVHTGERRWMYIPKDAEDMTVTELVAEHRNTTRVLLRDEIHKHLRISIALEIEEIIDRAADEITERVMQRVYRVPPRLMGRNTGTEEESPA